MRQPGNVIGAGLVRATDNVRIRKGRDDPAEVIRESLPGKAANVLEAKSLKLDLPCGSHRFRPDVPLILVTTMLPTN